MIELQYWSHMKRYNFIYKKKHRFKFTNEIDFVRHICFQTIISTIQPVWIYAMQKKESEWPKNWVYVILPFTNKSGLHCKIKRIFFLMCQIKMYWLNVSNSFFLFMSILNVSMWQDRGDQNDFSFGGQGMGGRVLLLLLFEWRSKVVTPDSPT